MTDEILQDFSKSLCSKFLPLSRGGQEGLIDPPLTPPLPRGENQTSDTPSKEALARAIEENAVEGVLRWGAWSGMEVHGEADLRWTITDVSFPIFNNVLLARLDPGQVDARIDAALTRVKARNVSMAWWLGPTVRPLDLGQRLENKGFVYADNLPGMAVDLLTINEDTPTSPGLTVEEVSDAEALEAWCRISAEGFDIPDDAFDAWSGVFSSVPFGPGQDWRHYLARLDGEPVGTSSVFYGSGVAGISNVATTPQARRQGVGTAVTVGPLQKALRLGYRIGTLFTSEMGLSVYQRLGFKEYCRGGLYIWMNE